MRKEACLRILDANFNRAKEALRVCEEVLRFIFDDRRDSLRCKVLRHRLTRIFLTLPVPYATIVRARKSETDVGRKRTIRDAKRHSPADIFLANIKRAEEAARVLEEFSKIAFPKKVTSFENLRFDLYELERKVLKKIS